MGRLKKVKQNRIHHEGISTLILGFAVFVGIVALSSWLLYGRCPIAFWTVVIVFAVVYAVIINFFRCPIRIYEGEMTDNVVVAPADGHVVVIEIGRASCRERV